MPNDISSCPYCHEQLVMWVPCDESGWDHDLLLCENNECSYFVHGRAKVCEDYGANFAYRFCYDPRTGREIPIVAWCGGDLSLLKGRCKSSASSECGPSEVS
jgi:hypothetical protein